MKCGVANSHNGLDLLGTGLGKAEKPRRARAGKISAVFVSENKRNQPAIIESVGKIGL